MQRILIPHLVMALLTCVPTAEAKEYLLYYLGGQSNMDGYGYVKDLPEELKEPVRGMMIYHGNTGVDGTAEDGHGIWAELQPGHGIGFKSNGKANVYSDRFGAELSFGRRIHERFPEANIAIIKYSKGGTSIDGRAARGLGSWDPNFTGGVGAGKGVNQFDHFLATLRGATAINDIDGDGERDTLVPAGIAWMQGESDANFTKPVAESYQANLSRLTNLIRAALRKDDLPLVIGRITDSGKYTGRWTMEHRDIVRDAQAAFVVADGAAALVTATDKYKFSDVWHYDSPAYLDLGTQFANALANLRKHTDEP